MIDEIRGRTTLSVPEAGRLIYGIGRDASYAAAERGEIPVLRLGRTLRVPTHAALRQVGMSEEQVTRTVAGDLSDHLLPTAFANGAA